MTALAVGVDIGGTKIAAGLVDVDRGAVVASLHRPTAPARGGEAVLADCVAMVADLLAGREERGMAPIGLGVPELVDPAGTIRSAFQVDWRTVDLGAAFAHLGLAHVESDVRAGALAESAFGAAAGCGSALYVSIGTGISSCFTVAGAPWIGRHGNAIVLASGPTLCLHPETGRMAAHVVERLASGPGVVARYRALGGGAGTAEEVAALAEAGDALAGDVLRDAADLAGNAIGQAVNLLDPEVVVLGGGLGVAAGVYRERLESSMRTTIWSEASREVPLRTSALGVRAGLIGAALAARRGVPAAIR